MTMQRDLEIAVLDWLVGTWTTEATHPAMPGVVVAGTTEIAWLPGERFLTVRAHMDHPDFPDSLAVLGRMDRDRVGTEDAAASHGGEPTPLGMHYFDSRGVFRAYAASVDAASWRWWRNVPGFSQRFTGRLLDGGDTIDGQSQLCRDDVHWVDDLRVTYRRQR